MTDLEVIKRFAQIAGIAITSEFVHDGNDVVEFSSEQAPSTEYDFTKRGYDDFHLGGEFDASGKMIRGYLDSHVAYSSENANYICSLKRDVL